MKKISYIIFSLFIVLIALTSFIKADSLFFKSNKNKALKEEDVTITLDLNTITYEKYNVTITSSDNISSLTTNDITLNVLNNEISFDIDTLSMDIRLITFNYKVSESLNEGDTVVFTAKITEINETGENNSVTEYVTITVDKKKEEKPQDNNQNPNNGNTKPNMNTTNKINTSSFNRSSSTNSFSFSKPIETVTYNGSDNNYLNSLSIKGYKFDNSFSKEKTTYFVTVKNNTKKVTVKYKKSSSKSKVIVTGNTNLKVGINKVLVTVNAENGNSRVYRIYVTREGNS